MTNNFMKNALWYMGYNKKQVFGYVKCRST